MDTSLPGVGRFYDDRIKLRHLRVIAAVDAHKGISSAALALGISPAAVSKTVSELETLVGMDLLERVGRNVRLTDAGRLAVSAAQVIAREFSVLGREIGLMQTGEVGTLVLGLQAVSNGRQIARAVGRFKAICPRSRVELIDGVLADLFAQLRRGSLDLVIGRLIPEMLGSDLCGIPLSDDRYLPVTTDPTIAVESITEWEQVLGELWCLPPAGTPVRNIFAAFLAARNLALPARLVEAKSVHLMFWLMKEMRFSALLPTSLVKSWGGEVAFRVFDLELGLALKPIGLVWSKKLPISPAATLFRRIVEEERSGILNI